MRRSAVGTASDQEKEKENMKHFKLGVQLYSVRDDASRDIEGTLRAVKEMGYDGVELAGLYGKTPEELKALAESFGLTVISAHTGLWETRGMGAKAVAEQYRRVGCRYIAIASMANEDRPGGDNFANASAEIAELAEACKEEGITLLYHNHDFEFAILPDGSLVLEGIYGCASPELLQTEIDTCWANTAGYNPAALVSKYAGRAPLVHLKDFSGLPDQSRYDNNGLNFTRPADVAPFSLQPVGRGVQDVPAIVAAAEAAGTEWLIVEQDDPAESDTPMESIAYSASYLTTLLGR